MDEGLVFFLARDGHAEWIVGVTLVLARAGGTAGVSPIKRRQIPPNDSACDSSNVGFYEAAVRRHKRRMARKKDGLAILRVSGSRCRSPAGVSLPACSARGRRDKWHCETGGDACDCLHFPYDILAVMRQRCTAWRLTTR